MVGLRPEFAAMACMPPRAFIAFIKRVVEVDRNGIIQNIRYRLYDMRVWIVRIAIAASIDVETPPDTHKNRCA